LPMARRSPGRERKRRKPHNQVGATALARRLIQGGPGAVKRGSFCVNIAGRGSGRNPTRAALARAPRSPVALAHAWLRRYRSRYPGNRGGCPRIGAPGPIVDPEATVRSRVEENHRRQAVSATARGRALPLSVKMKRSMTPLHYGSPTYDVAIVVPSHFTLLIRAWARDCSPNRSGSSAHGRCPWRTGQRRG
jgi:hypothetical protein